MAWGRPRSHLAAINPKPQGVRMWLGTCWVPGCTLPVALPGFTPQISPQLAWGRDLSMQPPEQAGYR